MSTVLRSQIQCGNCRQIIASLHRHDFRSCRCGLTSIDGGRDYLRVLHSGKRPHMRSIVVEPDLSKEDARRCIEVLNFLWTAGGVPPNPPGVKHHPYIGEPPYVPLSQLKWWMRQQHADRLAMSVAQRRKQLPEIGYDVREVLLRLEEEGLVTCRQSKTGKRTGWRCTKPMVGFGWYKGQFERKF